MTDLETPLRRFRAARKLSLTAAADLFGVHKTTFLRWERSGIVPVSRIVEIERVTGIPRHEIRPDIFLSSLEETRGLA